MVKLTIDGAFHTGNYRVDCECDATWHGQGAPLGRVNFSPAIAVAECVVHMKLCHKADQLDIRFTERFRAWLIHYWERDSLRRQDAGSEPAYGVAQRGRP
jgi:hypothetical protein